MTAPNSAPAAPGRIGEAVDTVSMRTYLDALHSWIQLRRSELDEIDQAIQSAGADELTGDILLSMTLWKAVQDREQLLLATWDGGRVGPTERERLSALVWGRMDATLDPTLLGRSSVGAELGSSLTVSLPEACRLSDALAHQLRMRLALDPNADAHAEHIKDLRAQLERLRDQVALEPQHTRPAAQAKLDHLVQRLELITEKASRGGDVGGLLGPMELDAATFERDMIVGGAHRREARDKLNDAKEARESLAAREAALHKLAEQCVRTVDPAPKYAVPDVEALGPPPNTPAGLDAYLTKLARVGKAMGMAQEAYARAIAEKDEVTGQLEGYRAKAAAHGVEDHPDLRRAYGLASETLGRRPAPLLVCRQLVKLYQTYLEWALSHRRPQARGGAR